MTRGLGPADVVVAGSGLAAVAIALELARRDLAVALVCEGRAGTPSAPGAPVAAQTFVEEVAEARMDLLLLSRHLFPDWIGALEEETGLSCEYDERGGLAIAFDEAEEVLLDRTLDGQRARSLPIGVLEPEEATEREGGLTPSTHAAFSFPRDGVARAGRVGRALALALRSAGVRLLEDDGLRRVSLAGGRASGVETTAGALPADTVVLAGRTRPDRAPGSPPLPLAVSSRTWMRLDAVSDPDRPTRLLASRRARVVPRRDGSVIVAGPASPGGAPTHPTGSEVSALLAELARLFPSSGSWGLVGAGSGREARAPDQLPLLGETGSPGLFAATGWGPDELLLAPAAAAIVADLLTGKRPPVSAASLAPGRSGAGPGGNGILFG